MSHKQGDHQACADLIAASCQRLPMRVVAYCLIPNHFHLLLWPWEDGNRNTQDDGEEK